MNKDYDLLLRSMKIDRFENLGVELYFHAYLYRFFDENYIDTVYPTLCGFNVYAFVKTLPYRRCLKLKKFIFNRIIGLAPHQFDVFDGKLVFLDKFDLKKF